MAYQIQIKSNAEKVIRKLPRNLRARIDTAIRKLAENPNPVGCRKLEGFEMLCRVRVGDWRIVYAVYEEQVVIVVVEGSARGNAYRNL